MTSIMMKDKYIFLLFHLLFQEASSFSFVNVELTVFAFFVVENEIQI